MSDVGRRETHPIALENRRTGTDAWWGPMAPQHAIEGYAHEASLLPGDVLALSVSTRPAARYRIEVLRLGWYEGQGARAVSSSPAEGSSQGLAREVRAPDVATGRCTANWPVSDHIRLAPDLTTGQYIARLLLVSGPHAGTMAYVPFVVRPPVGTLPAVLVQMGVTTAQAYNHWGGKSLYPSNSTSQEPAVKVSFDRPFPAWPLANLNARWPFSWDYQLIRFLEREALDVGYTTDIDTHREPWSLLGHRLLVTSGHDEYWTHQMRRAFEHAAAAGANLACMGANTCYWQARLEDGERTLVEYRTSDADPCPDPALKTVRFRDLTPPRPECRLLGVQYQEGMTAPGLPPRDYVLHDSALGHPWLQDTGFERGARLAGLVGYEWDALGADAEPREMQRFFTYENELSNADAISHRLPDGATVFSAGSLQFAWGLDDWGHDGHADPRLQRFMRNALDDLVASARIPELASQ